MTITQSTLKELWGASKNECAHPDCDMQLADPDGDGVIGEICHIQAQNEGGPRYDSSLDEEEVDSASNLILLCPTHHTVVDKNPEDYSSRVLESWKEEQLTEGDVEVPETDSLLNELVANTESINVEGGSFIVTNNQMGGQVADEITNIGQQPRRIPPAARQEMVQQLAPYDPGPVTVTGIMGDGESLRLAEEIMDVLDEAGWDVSGPNQVVLNRAVQEIQLRIPEDTEAFRTLGNLFLQLGFSSAGYLEEEKEGIEVIVGSNI
ncbi:HNH endonuclease signature motif containing protein [Halostella salina]|uniref:HNH endonuclease signature motif containing protein n=1 Tax=Halostella salina TaxID=1547897 RepID=UPI000EF7E99B|nr:HNH endonuclease signature motif containing protein [Halostella salina]